MNWKERRKLSYLMNEWDDINLPYTINTTNVKEQVVKFFKQGSSLIFPAKSMFVAIVYAKGLEKYFGEDFYKVLNDKDLLPDDKFFKTYDELKDDYDYILSVIGDIWKYPSINKTMEYFNKEFLVSNKPLYNK